MTDSERRKAGVLGLAAGFLMASGAALIDYKSEDYDLSEISGSSVLETYSGLFFAAGFLGAALNTARVQQNQRMPRSRNGLNLSR